MLDLSQIDGPYGRSHGFKDVDIFFPKLSGPWILAWKYALVSHHESIDRDLPVGSHDLQFKLG